LINVVLINNSNKTRVLLRLLSTVCRKHQLLVLRAKFADTAKHMSLCVIIWARRRTILLVLRLIILIHTWLWSAYFITTEWILWNRRSCIIKVIVIAKKYDFDWLPRRSAFGAALLNYTNWWLWSRLWTHNSDVVGSSPNPAEIF
jgi:hypothetical protein